MRGSRLLRVDTRNEIREFLTSRRAKLKAADVGLPDYGPRACLACDARKWRSWPG